uniref:C2H2-type domain-containing protein n=1 Tax=Trichogramma kaykai TaxID=54128 RepID=A0ABD2WPQ6_9HYME
MFGSRPGPNLPAVIEDDSPNDSRQTNFSGNGSTGNIINPETKDVEEKVTGGDANELETQIDSQSVKENEIGTNPVILHDSHRVQFILQPYNLEHYTHNENPQNLQSSVNRRHSDSKVPTYRNWSPGDPRPSTSSPNSMQRHNLFKSVTTKNRNRRGAQGLTFPCDLCNKSYANQRNLKRHMLTHTGMLPYTCDMCDKSYSHKYDRYRHTLKCTGKKFIRTCPECNKNFSSFEKMMTHRQIHVIEKPLKCPLCEYATHRKDGLSSHMKTHSTDRVSSSSSTSPGANPAEPVCQELPEAAQAPVELAGNETIWLRDQIAPQKDQPETSQPSENPQNLQSSVNRRHSDSKVPTYRNWSPGDPRPSTSSPNSMQRHNLFESVTTNNRNSRSAQDETFPCDRCNKSYSHKYDRYQHTLNCTAKKLRCTCPECDEMFISFEKMIIHRHIHAIEKPLKCPLCEYATHRKDGLSSHMKTHSTDRVSGSSSTSPGAIPAEPVCQELPEAAQAPVELAGNETILLRDQIAPQVDQDEMSQPDHDSKTIGPSNSESAQDETFPCDLYQQSFTRKHDRYRHMLKCTGKKPYPCELCNKSYANQRNLERHMFTHTGKNLKWTCPECDKNFSSFEEMMTHRHIHAIEKPHKCPMCEYATHRKDGLSSHMKTHSTDRVSSSSSTSEARPTHPGSSQASPATRPASNHSNEQQLPDQIPAEPVRQEQPEAAEAPVEVAGNETILLRDQIANNGPFDGADRIREEASEVPLIVNNHNVIDNSHDTNNGQLFQFQQENNSTNTPWVDEFDFMENLYEFLTPNLLAVLEDDSPNDSRETDFSGNGSTRNIINTETKDVEEKDTGGDANELEMQIDSQSDKENEIGTNTDLVHNNDQLSLSLNLEHYTHNENPQNLQSSVNRCHLDLDVFTLHSNEQQLQDQIPAESVRQKQPEAAQAPVELAGNETIWLRDQIAPQKDQDEMWPPDQDGETIAPRYHPNL